MVGFLIAGQILTIIELDWLHTKSADDDLQFIEIITNNQVYN